MPWDRSRPRSGEYGWDHTKARRKWAAQHDPSDPCVRCGHPLGPMGSWLHLDHNRERTGYLGFSHGARCPVCLVRCNVRAGAKEGRRRQEPVQYGPRVI